MTPRVLARAAGEKTYFGLPCKYHGVGVPRATCSGHCRKCMNEKSSIRAKVVGKEYFRLATERYRLKYPGKNAETQRAYYKRNTELARARSNQWKRDNRGAATALQVRRHANQKQRTPAWADMARIKAVYISAAELSKATGVMYHVDHIVPLQGRTVCGLHVHENLQVLPAKVNIAKSNKFDE